MALQVWWQRKKRIKTSKRKIQTIFIVMVQYHLLMTRFYYVQRIISLIEEINRTKSAEKSTPDKMLTLICNTCLPFSHHPSVSCSLINFTWRVLMNSTKNRGENSSRKINDKISFASQNFIERFSLIDEHTMSCASNDKNEFLRMKTEKKRRENFAKQQKTKKQQKWWSVRLRNMKSLLLIWMGSSAYYIINAKSHTRTSNFNH